MGRYDVKNYACPRCGSIDLVVVHVPFCSHGRVDCKDCGAREMRWEHLTTKELGAKLREEIKKREVTTRHEKSLLLYLETCLVDQYGRVEAQRMNTEDFKIIDKFVKIDLIIFGRLAEKAIQRMRYGPDGKIYTHYVRFSAKAWELAHQFRKERSERMITKNNIKLLQEVATGGLAK